MVREFKIRRTPFKVWLGVIIVIVAIVLMALHTENYWNLMPIVLPVLLLIDEQMTRILVQGKRGYLVEKRFQWQYQGVWSKTDCIA